VSMHGAMPACSSRGKSSPYFYIARASHDNHDDATRAADSLSAPCEM
jgi:hypothetical protein